jgi:GMP synthase (glutamine-hydrolysing)
MAEKIIILDFGSQYTQLIARRVREQNVYCEIHPYNKIPTFDSSVKGLILSGSPCSVRDNNAPSVDITGLDKKFPILGVCFGAQMIAHQSGFEVKASSTREYGRAHLANVDQKEVLFEGVDEASQVWMSHGDTIQAIKSPLKIIAGTDSIGVAAFRHESKEIYALQFHPEVTHSTQGALVLKNFLVKICKCKCDWTPTTFVDQTVASLKAQIGDDKVVLGLSGGVDSSVAAVLIHKAIGKNLYCIFVDNGLLRKNEFEEVLASYQGMGLNVKGVNASQLFYKALKDHKDPEKKRKAIGKTFIDVFDEESKQIKDVKWLAQGTIYPDVIESVSVGGPSVTIKSHHNVGGLPDYMKLQIVEPLRLLFKDEVRKVGLSMGLPQHLIGRHPFPGPGLAIRILSDVTEEKVRILQEVDHIFIKGLRDKNLYDEVWPVQSVGVMGDERTYESVVSLRAVSSVDGMTADWSRLPYEFLAEISNKIINNVKGVNRVVYDISSKPPATIEWE